MTIRRHTSTQSTVENDAGKRIGWQGHGHHFKTTESRLDTALADKQPVAPSAIERATSYDYSASCNRQCKAGDLFVNQTSADDAKLAAPVVLLESNSVMRKCGILCAISSS